MLGLSISLGVQPKGLVVLGASGAAVPSAPLNLVSTGQTDTTIDLTWDPPASDGGSPITQYRITISSPTVTINTGDTDTEYTLTGLSPETEYTISVKAVNAVGAGPASNEIVVETDTSHTPANIVSYYKLDETSGTRVDQFGGYDLPAIKEADAGTVGAAAGVIGNAASFPGDGNVLCERVDTNHAIPNTSTSYEFWGWLYPAASGTRMAILKRSGNGVGSLLEYMLRIDTLTPAMYWGVPGSHSSLAWGSALSLNTWAFVQFGYDASDSKFFLSVNRGTKVKSAAVTNQVVNGNNPFGLGGNNTLNELWQGRIDEVGFVRGAILSDAEADYFYNSGNGNTLP